MQCPPRRLKSRHYYSHSCFWQKKPKKKVNFPKSSLKREKNVVFLVGRKVSNVAVIKVYFCVDLVVITFQVNGPFAAIIIFFNTIILVISLK